MTTDPTIETPEQAVERLRQHRALIALEEAPELLRHVRSQIAASDGRPEAGEVYRPMSSPLRLSPTDDSDGVFGWFVFWAQTWSKHLAVKLPTSAVIAYTGDDGIPLGFRAGVTPDQARDDTRMVARWLTARFEAIAAHPDGADFFDVVHGVVRDLRGRYPMKPGKERLTSDRLCPVCATKAVRAVWHSADLLDVSIECVECTEAFVAKRGTIEGALGESVCSHIIPPLGEHAITQVPSCERCGEVVPSEAVAWLREHPASAHRRAPVRLDGWRRGRGSISWAEHEEAWDGYRRHYPGSARHQDAERIAERGGFGEGELLQFLGRAPETLREEQR